ncbi:MAG TPA: translation initiation factor IF-2 subunit alpha [Thermoprotei archaeon]|nr:translation initiation factor IF-2 subunit alpha [Thermoprotei archaeon]
MNSLKKIRYPKYNELVIGRVKKIFEHGAFIILEEYPGLEAYCPLREVSRSWFKGIREVLKEGQKRVFKVIRVDRTKGHVDVSLKRVSDSERKNKLREWKREQRAKKFFEFVAKKSNIPINILLNDVYFVLEKYYGEAYAGIEDAVRYGVNALLKAGVSPKLAEIVTKYAREYIEVPQAKISGIFIISCFKPNGIDIIRESLIRGLKIASKYSNINVKIYTQGAPRYKIDLIAPEYKTAEKVLEEIVNEVVEYARENECNVRFERLKSG